MAATGSEINVHDHGERVPAPNVKAKCNYCGKIVSGFSRLKKHLGGMTGGDVKSCQKVPAEVKEQFELQIREKKKRKLRNEVGALDHPNRQLKRHRSANSDGGLEMNRKKRVQAANTSSESYSLQTLAARLARLGKWDTSVPKSSYDELRGFIFSEERKRMGLRIKEIRSSWATTGCSILVDGWRDARGRDLINILVDCPKGPVYLRSLDVSAANTSADAMHLVFSEAISEVGAGNVLQIVLSSTMPYMIDVAKKIMRNHKTIFWAVSSTNCIELMLESIAKMDHTSCILNKATTLT